MKRTDYISWDQYFMGIAMLSAERSKDPSTQVGACIVDENNRLNAILNYRGGSLKDARIYSTLFPCNECAKAIIQCGIKEVIYCSDKYSNTDSTIASKRMFDMAGITYRPFEVKGRKITFDL